MKSIPIPDSDPSCPVYTNDYLIQVPNEPDRFYNTANGQFWSESQVCALLNVSIDRLHQMIQDMDYQTEAEELGRDADWLDEQRTRKSLLDDMRQF